MMRFNRKLTAFTITGASLVAAGLLAFGCGKTTKQEYTLLIWTSTDPAVKTFAGAKTVVLSANGTDLVTVPFNEMKFELKAPEVVKNEMVSFKVRALDEAGKIVAYGETPPVETLESSPPAFYVVVQKPGTFVTAPRTFQSPFRGHFAAGVMAALNADNSHAIPGVLVGLGEVRVFDEDAGARDQFSNALRTWNPLTLLEGPTEVILGPVNPSTYPVYRKNVGSLVMADGRVLLFGGAARVTPSSPATVDSREYDIIRLQRDSFLDLQEPKPESRGPYPSTLDAGAGSQDESGLGRQAPVLASGPTIGTGGTTTAETLYAIGGWKNGTKAAEIVVIIDNKSAVSMSPVTAKMAAGRAGHTVSTIRRDTGLSLLIVGGADKPATPDLPQPPLGELFTPGTNNQGTIVAVGGSPGPMRTGHAAQTLPNGRVLIIGGRDENGVALGSSVQFDPVTSEFAASPLVLATPRSDFVAFQVGNDLVFAGGRDATGTLIPNAEIFDKNTLAPAGVVPCLGRTGAAVTNIPAMDYVFMIGGEVASTTEMLGLTQDIELYQPRRL